MSTESPTPPSPFSPEVRTAVVDHMNDDHPDDNLLIVRALGGQPDASAAVMTGYHEQGATFSATVGGTDIEVTVPWAVPIEERATIRHEVVRMYQESCAALGVTPRGEGSH